MARLGARFDLLVSRRQRVPARHRTLRAALEWSFDLLSADRRRFLARLSVFHGGWTAEAAEVVVCARQPESERYRIPKQFRGRQYNAARDGAWAGTAKVLEYISREGLPDSCSPIGSNGQSGCFRKFLEQNSR